MEEYWIYDITEEKGIETVQYTGDCELCIYVKVQKDWYIDAWISLKNKFASRIKSG